VSSVLACPLTCCFARVLCVLDRSRVARAAHDQINYEEFVKMMMCVSPNSPLRPAPPLAPACLLPTARPPCRSLLRRPARACALLRGAAPAPTDCASVPAHRAK